jgi:hypothetical protein
MPDEIDEITNRSGTPRGTLRVTARRDPEPKVVLTLTVTRPDGVVDTFRLNHSPEEARRLSDYLLGMADAVTLEALADGGDLEAAELLAEMKRQLDEAEPIPEWYEDLDH